MNGTHYRTSGAFSDGRLRPERIGSPAARRTIGKRLIDPANLREDDIRGIVGKTLDDADAGALGAAFGTLVSERGGRTVALGFDGRLTSRALAVAFARGLIATGIHVARVGLGPTPMLYFANAMLRTDAAVMVTGSHDPPEYNGFKLTVRGRTLRRTDIWRLGEIAAAGAFAPGAGLILDRPVIDAYVERLIGDLSLARPLAVVWDASNGAAGAVLTKLCTRIPGRHVLLNEMVDGTFPSHRPDPTTPDALDQLRKIVVAEECELGVAFDGDGDRIGVIDGEGRVLWGDQILLLLARDVLRERPGATIIADVKASQTLFDEIARLGGRPVIARAGRLPIEAKIAETGAPLAGEMSGHIYLGDKYYGYDDALYAALRLMNVVSRADRSLAALRDGMPQTFNTPELSLPCADGRKLVVIDEIRARLAAAGAEVIAIDGVRVRTDDGWWLLRASTMRDALVACCEATTEAGLIRVKETLREQLERSGVPAAALGEFYEDPIATIG
ncbi:MAG: phosphomannomutase/phosphoglucomutase [Alphaproteobacteria bacterium]|nr:phosphomannomutase/phosphoglucomutase [Alphaproteobacteria bacterium]